MTTLIKKAGIDLIESLNTFRNTVCNDSRFCDDLMVSILGIVVGYVMWLSLAQIA
jgi:hypothetical protein